MLDNTEEIMIYFRRIYRSVTEVYIKVLLDVYRDALNRVFDVT